MGPQEDTIAAIATPWGVGGVGIVRLSGELSLPIADRIFRGRIIPSKAKSYTIHHGWIVEPKSDEEIDEVLLLLMRAPSTYTKEDVVEISAHGGPFLIKRILGLVTTLGARPAERGEFTYRAFMRGRMDLSQAEAILALVEAQTLGGQRIATRQLKGEFASSLGELREALYSLLVDLEASLDFPEEGIGGPHVPHSLSQLSTKVDSLIFSYRGGKAVRKGVKVAIVGKRNVGKSTLFNRFLGQERAIVTPYAGTTRDSLEANLEREGIPFCLVDTAGLGRTADPVEKEATQRSMEELEGADLLLFLVDSSKPLSTDDYRIWELTQDRERILVRNKIDLPTRLELKGLPGEAVEVSARNGSGMEELWREINVRLFDSKPIDGSQFLLSDLRHWESLKGVRDDLAKAQNALDRGLGEVAVLNLRGALKRLGELTGEEASPDILEGVFSRFCVGK